jgi:hypothetical protein
MAACGLETSPSARSPLVELVATEPTLVADGGLLERQFGVAVAL